MTTQDCLSAEERTGLFRRDAHLTDLSLERLLLGELPPEAQLEVEAHLNRCPCCDAALTAARKFGEELPSPEWAISPKKSTLGSWRGAWLGGLAAAAALLLFLLNSSSSIEPEPLSNPPDGIRVKAGALDFEVFVHDGEQQHRALDGEQIQAGDRLGFRVTLRQSAYLLIAGLDAQGEPYLCYPQGKKGQAVQLEGKQAPQDLHQAVRMDATSGQERLIALSCSEAFEYKEVAEALRAQVLEPETRLPLLFEHCAQRELRLFKP